MTVYKRNKTYIIFLMAAILVLLIFIITSIIFIIEEEYYKIILMSFILIFIGGLFLFISLSEHRSYLEIDNEKIIFHYMVFSKDKGLRGLNRKGLSINWKDVKVIKIRHIKGDKILSADTNFITFFLRDSRIFETTFFHFGKEKDREIISKIQTFVPQYKLLGDVLNIL